MEIFIHRQLIQISMYIMCRACRSLHDLRENKIIYILYSNHRVGSFHFIFHIQRLLCISVTYNISLRSLSKWFSVQPRYMPCVEANGEIVSLRWDKGMMKKSPEKKTTNKIIQHYNTILTVFPCYFSYNLLIQYRHINPAQ